MLSIKNAYASISFRRGLSKTVCCGNKLNLESSINDQWLNDLEGSTEEEIPEPDCVISKVSESDNDQSKVNYLDNIKYKLLGVDSKGLSDIQMTLKDYFMGNEHHTHNVFHGFSKFKQARKSEQRTFIDLKLIRVKSGKGGNGSASFFRDAFRPMGPPDGGDGGYGGNIYVNAVNNITSLHKVKRSYEARDGTQGMGKQLDGKNGEDAIIEVPVGTTVRWVPDPLELRKYLQATQQDLDQINLNIKGTGLKNDYIQFFRESFKPGEGWIFKEKEEDYFLERKFFNDLNEKVKEYDTEIINEELYEDNFPMMGIDFDKPTSKPVLLIKGGKGGMGNMHFLTKDIRNPKFCKMGRAGLTKFFLLELKLIADLGLVGLPNAGKSTLLRAISKARPRVGHWEFTTLQPTIGTIFTSIDKDPFTVADIPGIIKGASENKGMGLDFLRHIERSGGLVFVISLESKDPIKDLMTLINEVGPKRMSAKKILVVATKADLEQKIDKYNDLRKFIESQDWKIVPVCAIRGENIEKCIKMMSETAHK